MDKDLNRLTVLIPAYMPDQKLIGLAQSLTAQGFFEVVVVDDGGGEDYKDIFAQLIAMGCRVLTHAINMGKGRALKTGLNDILARGADIDGVITADADGQHLAADIIKVGKALLKSDNAIILGKRTLVGKVPWKSRAGNTITRGVFNLVSGQKIYDTQTGLRAMPTSALADLIELSGERYEYEMNVLLEAGKFHLTLKEVDIETVYINDNSGSHFNPWKDSWRIYRRIIMFGGSSLFAALIDYLVFALITILLPNILLAAVVGARVISSAANFFINRNVIFTKKDNDGNLKRHLIGYYVLVLIIMAANYGLIKLLQSFGINTFVAKVITDSILFFVSYIAQKRIVFK